MYLIRSAVSESMIRLYSSSLIDQQSFAFFSCLCRPLALPIHVFYPSPASLMSKNERTVTIKYKYLKKLKNYTPGVKPTFFKG